MDAMKKGWFSELSPEMWPGQCMSLEYEKVLEDIKSDYQHIVVFKSKTYGNVLVLDGVIQITERDECGYQEMITHLPMFCHPNPERVLIIGGGDGGVLREVLRHPCVKEVTQCEIDGKVIELSKKHLPGIASCFDDPRANVIVGDGFKFMKEHEGSFDVIITDSSDPIGPASSLFEKEYYHLMKTALRPGGIVCSQGECVWLHLDLIKSMQDFCKELYPTVGYAYATVPTYPSGQIGFTLCSLDDSADLAHPCRTLTQEQVQEMGLQYYNTDVHTAAFVLPQFARKKLASD
ncbi:spermidine synthase [Salpingoeca rosetta]|uniref:Spermidine synthase n=1 Tax=Salpingoeca rosetta (strain ATCC 50818 / BSB-021) TaxID=946362 RepID=F2UAN4_SALR5|nr:spermidine synthase [Salpingoeca rosetta]EGD73450.1 spermidine synthase [Salpingoeca rosetta]|eukprot:XP_004993732.1 spermidine synthase [Salpingoeca rosetta]